MKTVFVMLSMSSLRSGEIIPSLCRAFTTKEKAVDFMNHLSDINAECGQPPPDLDLVEIILDEEVK